MKTTVHTFLSASFILVFAACSQPDKKPAIDQSVETPAKSPDANNTGTDETANLNAMAEGNMMEVLLGNLAAENASDPRIKAYGKMLAKDHTEADKQLQALAQQRNIILPDELPAGKKQHIDMMKEQKGATFDQHYISMMIEDHKKDIEEFKKVADKVSDPRLAELAKNTLPVLQKHLDAAETIQKSMKK